MATDVKKVVDGLKKSVDEYSNIEFPQDATKIEALTIISKEISVINAVEKREFEEKLQRDEYELKKDHTYAQDDLEKKKLELEKNKVSNNEKLEKEKLELEKTRISNNEKLENEKLNLEKDKLSQNKDLEEAKMALEKTKLNNSNSIDNRRIALEELKLEIEQSRIDLEKMRFENDCKNLEIQNEIRRDNRKFQWITLGVTVGTTVLGFIGNMIVLAVKKKLAYDNLKLIYIDEGRPTTEWKDSVKDIKNITKI